MKQGNAWNMPLLQIQPRFLHGEQWSELAARKGLYYEPVEFYMPPVLGDPQLFDEARVWYRNSGRVCSLHGAFIDVNPASGDPEVQKLSQARCRESCALAAALGAKQVVFHSSAFPFLRGAYLDNWAGICGAFYMELAEEYGLIICVENSMDLDPEPLCALLRETSGDQVQVCLDIGHAHYARAPLEMWFERLGDRIGYLHLSDNNGQFDEHLPLGAGSVNWALADSLWRQLGRSIPLTLEVGGITGVERSLVYLKQRGYFGLGV